MSFHELLKGIYMILRLPQLQNTLIPNSASPADAVEYINSHIENNSCENMTVDLSFLNVIDTCYVTTLCSTKHYIKYPNGKITWKISSETVKEFNKALDLGNCEYIL